MFRFYGTVIATLDSPLLSNAIWQSEDFRYIHICLDTPKISINKECVFDYLGYKLNSLRGFMRVDSERWRNADPTFKYVEDLVEYLREIDEFENERPEEIEISVPVSNYREKLGRTLQLYCDICQKIDSGEFQVKIHGYEEPPEKMEKGRRISDTYQYRALPQFSKINEIKQNIGKIGEAVICQLEKNNLKQQHKYNLAERVEMVSEKSNQYGYDILSFYSDGQEKHIEVKTTTKGKAGNRRKFYDLQSV